MKLLFFGSLILFFGGLFFVFKSLNDMKVDQQGTLVKMRIEKLPNSCLGTRTNHYTTLSYNGKRYIKKISSGFCETHIVGEYLDIRFLDEESPILFPEESSQEEVISSLLISIVGAVITVLQWKKTRVNK